MDAYDLYKYRNSYDFMRKCRVKTHCEYNLAKQSEQLPDDVWTIVNIDASYCLDRFLNKDY